MPRYFSVFMLTLISVFVLFGCSKKEPQKESASTDHEPIACPIKQDAASAVSGADIEVKSVPCKAGLLDGLTYIKGQPVTLTEGKVYVVEYRA